MKNFALASVAVFGLLGSAGIAHAVVIDQSDYNDNTVMALFGQSDLAQSFTPSIGSSAGAGIFLNSNRAGSGNITIQLWNALPNVAGAQQLASGTAYGTSGNWVDVFWSAPVAVTPGMTYDLVLLSDNSGLGVSGDTLNAYSGGNVYANDGYDAFPDYDYTFRTYASAQNVPEPASLALLGMGVAGLVAARRRKAV